MDIILVTCKNSTDERDSESKNCLKTNIEVTYSARGGLL